MTTVDILYPSSQDMEVFKRPETEHPSNYLCRFCSKRFDSGRALGGHMRAHAPASIAADTLTETEFQKSKRPGASDHKSMEMKEEGLDNNGSNLMYALRRNPKRSLRFADRDYSFLLGHGFEFNPIDSSMNCDLCWKEFSSWKSLFSHMKCHSETHQDSGDAHLEESQKHEAQEDEEEKSESDVDIEINHSSRNSRKFDKWMKRKRSKRPRYANQLNPHEHFGSETSTEEEDMAMCLVMLSSGVNTAQNPQVQAGVEGPGSGDLKLSNTGSQLPKCIRKKPKSKKIDGYAGLFDDEVKKARYKCNTCNKVFHSHQALGGHRASHNKVKGCFLQMEEENESLEEEITDEELIPGTDSQLPGNFHKSRPKDCYLKVGIETSRIHECSICHKVFASGQALGGHKRCHWDIARASDSISTTSISKETPMLQQQMPVRVELWDLNLPAPIDDDCDAADFNNLEGNEMDSHGASDAQSSHSPPYLQSCLMAMK